MSIVKAVKAGMDPLAMMTKSKKKVVKKEEKSTSETKLPTLTEQITEQKKFYYSEEKIAFLRKFYNDEEFIRQNAELLPCEKIEIFEKASYKSEDPFSMGVLVLTKFRLIFKFEDPQQQKKLNLPQNYFTIPLFSIKSVSKNPTKSIYSIDIVLKDTRVIRFVIHNKNNVKFYGDLTEAVFPKDPKLLFDFSFEYLKYLFSIENFISGWELYDIEKEFNRQGILKEDANLQIRYTNINEKFELCQTYPPVLVVPVKITDNDLREAAVHRTKNRLPVLTYYYNKHGCHSSIWRSSQSKSGVTNRKSQGDIKLMENIISLNKNLTIFDARPFVNAFANKIKGGGYEDVEHYTNAELTFCDIDNIHVARKALESVYALAQSKDM